METSRLLGWAISRDKQEVDLKMAIEAILFVSGEAVTVGRLADVLESDAATVERLLKQLESELAEQDRGIQLRRVAGGFRLFSHPASAEYVKVWLASEGRRPLTNAALETLAIVAYRQPVSRAAVAAIRGVNSDAVLSGLTDKELITEVGREEGPGNAILYGTTAVFLERFGLVNLGDLPPTSDKGVEIGSGDSRETSEGNGQSRGGL